MKVANFKIAVLGIMIMLVICTMELSDFGLIQHQYRTELRRTSVSSSESTQRNKFANIRIIENGKYFQK